MDLRKVSTTFIGYVANDTFDEPFNQCMFQNLDPTNPVYINHLQILPNQQLNISLNAGEVNVTKYQLDFRGSTSGNVQIVYSQYLGIQA